MALQITVDQARYGGDFDETFIRNHRCGECQAPITQAWKDGFWWIRCGKVWDHNGFERIPGYVESWRRGENPMAQATKGDFNPQKTRNWRRRGTKRTTVK